MKTFVNLLIATLLVCSIQSCSFNAVRGNGTIVENEITISDYSNIAFSGSASLIYEHKPDVAPYLKIETDENIMPLLIIESKDSTLAIRNKENINPTKYNVYTNSTRLEKLNISGSVKVHLKNNLVTDHLNIQVSGSGNIIADYIECSSFKSKTSGSADITLTGKTNLLDCSISGSGKIKAQSMVADSVYCRVSGSGNYTVHANEYLKVSVSGSGSVRYKGDPKIDQSISGSGKVTRIE